MKVGGLGRWLSWCGACSPCTLKALVPNVQHKHKLGGSQHVGDRRTGNSRSSSSTEWVRRQTRCQKQKKRERWDQVRVKLISNPQASKKQASILALSIPIVYSNGQPSLVWKKKGSCWSGFGECANKLDLGDGVSLGTNDRNLGPPQW